MANEVSLDRLGVAVQTAFDRASSTGGITKLSRELQPYGPPVVSVCLLEVKRRIRGVTAATFLTMDELAADGRIVSTASDLLRDMRPLLNDLGPRGDDALRQCLGHPDEDIGALAASHLAATRIDLGNVGALRSALAAAFGTGYQLSLSFALAQHGEASSIAELARQYLTRSEQLRPLEQLIRMAAPAELVRRNGYDRLITAELVVPGSTGALPIEIHSQLLGLFHCVSLDLASNGMASRNFGGPWRRREN